MVGTEFYSEGLAELIKLTPTAMKVKDQVQKCWATCAGELQLDAPTVDALLDILKTLPTFQASLMKTVFLELESRVKTAVLKLISDGVQASLAPTPRPGEGPDQGEAVQKLVLLQKLVADSIVTWPLDDMLHARSEAIAAQLLKVSSKKRNDAFSEAAKAVNEHFFDGMDDYVEYMVSDEMQKLAKAIEACVGLAPFRDGSDDEKNAGCIFVKMLMVMLGNKPSPAVYEAQGMAVRIATPIAKFLPHRPGNYSPVVLNMLIVECMQVQNHIAAFLALGDTPDARAGEDSSHQKVQALQRGVDTITKLNKELSVFNCAKIENTLKKCLGIWNEAVKLIATHGEVVIGMKKKIFESALNKATTIQGGLPDGRHWSEGLAEQCSWDDFLKHAVDKLGSSEVAGMKLREAYQDLEKASSCRKIPHTHTLACGPKPPPTSHKTHEQPKVVGQSSARQARSFAESLLVVLSGAHKASCKAVAQGHWFGDGPPLPEGPYVALAAKLRSRGFGVGFGTRFATRCGLRYRVHRLVRYK